MTLQPNAAAIEHNIDLMRSHPRRHRGMDIVIVSTSTPELEATWQKRLEAGLGEIAHGEARVVAVCEDWPGGAGNGLGTLYALQKAREKLQRQTGEDLLHCLRGGGTVGLYHTAGKGQRLAPLPAAESNNKPGVKLPGRVRLASASGDPDVEPISILESVILQTAVYADSRAGRVSVFWGDQVFIPDGDLHYTPHSHADILMKKREMPSAEQWRSEGLDTYGLITLDAEGSAAQVEKVSFERVTEWVQSGALSVAGGIGVSLGSFSLSLELTEALLQEFSSELQSKQGKLDSDPHFWMPLTLQRETYQQVMQQKGESPQVIDAHYDRMQRLKARLGDTQPMLGGVDVGSSGYWWDYGQLTHYRENNLRLLGADPEGAAMRRFFGIEDRRQDSEISGVDCDSSSVLLGCNIQGGRVRNSVLIGVTAHEIDIEDSVVMQVAVPQLGGREVLLYDVMSEDGFCLDPGTVLAGVFLEDGRELIIKTDSSRDGRADWSELHSGNSSSYDDLHKDNGQCDPQRVQRLKKAAYERVVKSLTPAE